MENTINRMRHLTQMLVFSVAFNVISLALLFYWISKESPPKPYCELKPAKEQEQMAPLAISQSNEEILRQFRGLPKEDLMTKLLDKELVENGYAKRDLALSILVLVYHFDLPRALGSQPAPLQERKISMGSDKQGRVLEAAVFSGLNDEQFDHILRFAKTEKWPLTSRGLFYTLRKKELAKDPSLAEAFFLTQDFEAVQLLFTRSGVELDRQDLLQVMIEGTWNQIKEFVKQQKVVQDLSPARRQRFLLDYIESGSPTAAYLLLKTDAAFAAKKLDEMAVLNILKLIPKKSPESEQFLLELLANPRSDKVWQLAAERMYEYAGEPKPEKNIYEAALQRFLNKKPVETKPVKIEPEKKINKTAPTKADTKSKNIEKKRSPPVVEKPKSKEKENKKAPTVQLYTVQTGDSLWKIARRFNVEIDAIKKANNLKSDALKPGSTLKIPQRKK